MDNELGTLIGEEAKRAEADFNALRTRGQAVLTAAGGLATLLGGVLALAVGKDEHLVLTGSTSVLAIVALGAFVLATVLVLLIYLPATIEAPKASDLADLAENNWTDDGWDQQVAILLTTYLTSLRQANAKGAIWLTAAIAAEVVGVIGVALMATSIVIRA